MSIVENSGEDYVKITNPFFAVCMECGVYFQAVSHAAVKAIG